MRTLGICFGASALQCVILSSSVKNREIESAVRIHHDGNPKKILLDFLADIDLTTIDKVAVTGRNFRKNVRLSSISEAVAVEKAIESEYPHKDFPDFVISSGGETQLAYKIGKNGNIISVHSGNKCASGTGEFFLQQIGRMNLSLEEAIGLAESGTPHKIAGRCSVFCKSDCTHALNKGEPKANVTAGLCRMMADRMLELLKDAEYSKIAFIGGGSLNRALVNVLSEQLPKVDIPKQSAIFEAYGAALWAAENNCIPMPRDYQQVVAETAYSFGFHAPLAKSAKLVVFKNSQRIDIIPGDEYIVGLDVGSTTTKAVLIHKETNKIAADVYGRTNGNPILASRECYKSIREQIGTANIKVIGLGVTGSGRQIAALHALASFVVNEITAHATAAAYFDPEVDTIFEIGGQDAKYTYLTGGVPSDYAMNEACSAGTGSFLEESAKESLNVATTEIGALALQGENPPNFTDQCAAFISSDIKRASQEGIARNDILAGLVYSICMNYLNRVKESRPVGKKIFMQGGVCYNQAVPVAMASLMHTPIVVPPDPGLMGAFGIALEFKKQLELGFVEKDDINLDELIAREAQTIGSFVCAGGKEHCDRKCEIAKIKINDDIFPFGGACDRYYNLRLKKSVDPEKFDYVAIRQNLLKEYLPKQSGASNEEVQQIEKFHGKVGIMRSFLTHSLAPLYANFFNDLGFEVVFADEIEPEGIARIESAFCLPAEISHGSFLNLIRKNLDYIFLPHVKEMPVANVQNYSGACVFVQSEPYFLKTAFRKEIEQTNTKILAPFLNMGQDYKTAQSAFVAMAKQMGTAKKQALSAFDNACKKQHQFEQDLIEHGKSALAYLNTHPEEFGIVLLGRPYNTFTDDANMGIPHKIASRGVMVIPFDMLDIESYQVDSKMYWAMGQKIMKTAEMVKQRENLFAFYVTNFSCGPDSFILGYFRNLMGMKPSLTLELDQHTADAGIDTRIEAALSIMKSYRSVLGSPNEQTDANYRPARMIQEGEKVYVISSAGTKHALTDSQVELLFPTMGQIGTEAVAAIMRNSGVSARALPVPDKDVLLEGKKNSLCKECLPFMLTTGSFMSYLKAERNPDKVTLLFLPTGEGPCRLGQYCKSLEQVISKNKIPDTAVFTLSDENCYAGLGEKMLLRAMQAIIITDVLDDIRSMLAVAAKDKNSAKQEFENIWWQELMPFFEGKTSDSLVAILARVSARLKEIPLAKNPHEVPIISLSGEIYVRSDEFSRQEITDYLEERGFMVKVAPISEYICYINYMTNCGIGNRDFTVKERFASMIKTGVHLWWERRIKSVLMKSGLYEFEMTNVSKTIKAARHLVDERLFGESILTIGVGMREILHGVCGVISIGPFGCMPSRVAESILRKEMNIAGKQRLAGWQDKAKQFTDINTLPYLAIETDGAPLPQMVEANLEAFILQAQRVHERMTATFK